MQADPDLRRTPDDLLKLPVRNRLGDIVLLGEIAQPKWIVGLACPSWTATTAILP